MGCGGSKGPAVPDIDLDFGSPEPHDEAERRIYEQVKEALDEGPKILELLRGYEGCEEPIRKALNDPGPKTEQAAWKAVSKAVDKLYEFYKFSLTLEKVWPLIMDAECSDDGESIRANVALAKQVAQLFDFVFHFDEAKMINPAIQNDFSYYRRVLSRMKNANKEEKAKVKVDEELANKMSFFFAYPTPMMKVVIDATTEFDKAARPRLIAGLASLANLCLRRLDAGGEEEGAGASQHMLFLCAMTGAIILVDHLHDEGAFHAKSPVRIKQAITALKGHAEPTDFLLNSLRFTTLHLNDEQTMPAISKLLA